MGIEGTSEEMSVETSDETSEGTMVVELRKTRSHENEEVMIRVWRKISSREEMISDGMIEMIRSEMRAMVRGEILTIILVEREPQEDPEKTRRWTKKIREPHEKKKKRMMKKKERARAKTSRETEEDATETKTKRVVTDK